MVAFFRITNNEKTAYNQPAKLDKIVHKPNDLMLNFTESQK
jgi:hypothetical protein